MRRRKSSGFVQFVIWAIPLPQPALQNYLFANIVSRPRSRALFRERCPDIQTRCILCCSFENCFDQCTRFEQHPSLCHCRKGLQDHLCRSPTPMDSHLDGQEPLEEPPTLWPPTPKGCSPTLTGSPIDNCPSDWFGLGRDLDYPLYQGHNDIPACFSKSPKNPQPAIDDKDRKEVWIIDGVDYKIRSTDLFGDHPLPLRVESEFDVVLQEKNKGRCFKKYTRPMEVPFKKHTRPTKEILKKQTKFNGQLGWALVANVPNVWGKLETTCAELSPSLV